MPVLAQFSGIVIRLLCLNRLGHRLHAFRGDEEMVVDLDNLRCLSGNLSSTGRELVLDWARQHRWEILRSLPSRRSWRPSMVGV